MIQFLLPRAIYQQQRHFSIEFHKLKALPLKSLHLKSLPLTAHRQKGRLVFYLTFCWWFM